MLRAVLVVMLRLWRRVGCSIVTIAAMLEFDVQFVSWRCAVSTLAICIVLGRRVLATTLMWKVAVFSLIIRVSILLLAVLLPAFIQ